MAFNTPQMAAPPNPPPGACLPFQSSTSGDWYCKRCNDNLTTSALYQGPGYKIPSCSAYGPPAQAGNTCVLRFFPAQNAYECRDCNAKYPGNIQTHQIPICPASLTANNPQPAAPTKVKCVTGQLPNNQCTYCGYYVTPGTSSPCPAFSKILPHVAAGFVPPSPPPAAPLKNAPLYPGPISATLTGYTGPIWLDEFQPPPDRVREGYRRGCSKCGVELCDYLDSYHGKDPTAAGQCFKCRDRNS